MARRTFLLTAATGLALAPAAAAAPSRDLYLARDACGGSGVPQNERLSPELGAYSGYCGSGTGAAIDSETIYPSLPGPLTTLDPTRKVFVAIETVGQGGAGVGLGEQRITVRLTGRDSSNRFVSLGSATQTKDAAAMLRGADYTAEFELPLTAAKKGPFRSFSLTLTVGGSALGGYVHHGGNSFVSLPLAPVRSVSRR